MSKTDGYLKIKTKIDNSGVDKDVEALENKIKKLQESSSNSVAEESSLQQEIDNYEQLCNEADAYKQKIKEITKEQSRFKGQITGKIQGYEAGITEDNYSNAQTQLLQIQQKYKSISGEIDKQAPKIDKVHTKLEKIKTKQMENNAKITEFKERIEQIKLNKIQQGLNSVGKNLQNSIGRIGKMALAVVGIRTAWNAVRSAMNLASQYNPQIAADFEYIKFCIANMVIPAVQKLVSLLYTVLSYINAIASAWFGINLFGNSSVKAFQKMQKSAGGTAKSAKEIQKSLQGFDEMNVISDTSSSSAGGGGGVAPNIDLSGAQGEIPGWIQWIIDNKDLLLGVITGLTAGLISLKLLGLKPLMSLGIGIAIAGVVDTVKSIIRFIKDPSWENFIEILEGISIALLGIGIIVGLITGNWVPLIIGVIMLIATEVVKHWDKIKAILGIIGQWVYDNVITPVWTFIQMLIGVILGIISTAVTTINGIMTYLVGILLAPFQTLGERVQGVFNGIKQIVQGILKVFKGVFTGDMKTVLNGFKQIFKGVFDSLWAIAKAPINLIIRGLNSLIRGANKIKFDVPDWVPGFGGKQFGFHISEIPLLAKGTVVSRPTPAIIGEAGAEMVMPLENNLEWLDVLASKLAGKIGGNGGSYVINIDSRTVQRGIAKRKQELAFATNGRM